MRNIILFLLFISISLAAPCFQEDAQVTDQTGLDGTCGLEYTGVYSVDTNASGPDDAGSVNYMNVNYSKPNSAQFGSLWQVQHGEQNAGNADPILPRAAYNITLPVQCWNAYPDKISLRIVSQPHPQFGVIKNSQPSCWNGTSFELIGSLFQTTNSRVENNLLVTPVFWHDGNYSTFSSGTFVSTIWQDASTGINFGHMGDAEVFEESMFWNISNYVGILSPGNGSTFLNPFPVPFNIQSFPDSVCNLSINSAFYSTFNNSFNQNVSGSPIVIGANNVSVSCTFLDGSIVNASSTFQYILPEPTTPFKNAFDIDITNCPLNTYNHLIARCIEYYKIPSVFNFSAVPCRALNFSLDYTCITNFSISNITKVGPFDNWTIFYTPSYWQYHGAINVSNISMQLTGAEFIYNSKYVTHNPCDTRNPQSCGPQGMQLIDNDSFMYVPAQFKPQDCGYFYTSIFGANICSYGYGFVVNNRIIAVADNKNQWYTAAGFGISNNTLIPPEPVIYVNVVPLPESAINPFFDGFYTRLSCVNQNDTYRLNLKNTIEQVYTVFITLSINGTENQTSFSIRSTELNSNIPLTNVIEIEIFDNNGRVCAFGEQSTLFLPFDIFGGLLTDGFGNFFVKIIMLFTVILSAMLPYTLLITFIYNDLYHVLSVGEFGIISAIALITGIANNTFSPERGIKNLIVITALCLAYMSLLDTQVRPFCPTAWTDISTVLLDISNSTTANPSSLVDQIVGFAVAIFKLLTTIILLPGKVFFLISCLLAFILPIAIWTPLSQIMIFLSYGATIWFWLKAYEIGKNIYRGI